jgi:ubiquinone/menaquinone biosynthesis C-methylase UbiE
MNSYRKLCTEFYDIDKPTAPEDAFAFYLRYAKEANGPILEPMCGSGRFLLPLLEQGFDIEGADGSPDMLQACREKAEKRGLTPVLYQQLLHPLELPRQYNLILIPAGSFCLLTDPAQARESLQRLYALLLPGAKLVLEIERYKPQSDHSWPWGGRWVERPDGAKIICSWLGHYKEAERVSYSLGRYELVKDGQLLATEFEDFNLRFYDPEEFRTLLETAGFTAIHTFKAYASCAPEETDESILFECAKP